MRLIRVPMTVDTPGSTYNIHWTPPEQALVAAVGFSIDKLAALYDTEVTSVTHGGREAVTKSTVSGTEYGIPLGHFANYIEHEAISSAGVLAAPSKFKPWPGRYNLPADWQSLVARLQNGEALSPAEKLRVRMARRVPCEGFAAWPLQRQVKFNIALKRIYGTTAPAYAYLWVIEFENAEEMALFCGQPDLTDYPHWLGQGLILAAAAGTDQTRTERLWQPANMPAHALRIQQFFAMGHENNSETIAYNAAYPASVLVNVEGGDGGSVFPSYADARAQLHTLAPQVLQHYDCARDPELLLPWNGSLLFETQRLLTDYQKDIRLTAYGLLRPQDALTGGVADAA